MHPSGLLRTAPWILAAGLGLVAFFAPGHAVQADDTSAVVARIGARAITVADLERRLAAIPPFQLRTFGGSPDEIKKNYLERVLVREALLAQGAEARGLLERDDIKERLRGVMRNAMLAHLRGEVAQAAKPTEDEIRAYYQKNITKFRTPARVGLQQIVTAKREEALEVVAEMKKDPTQAHWNALCHERSIDRASNMRGGSYGYVFPDGTTSDPALRVGAEILKALAAARDGELLPEPVKDGEHWAVVWRQKSMPAVDRPVELEIGSIRQILLHERTEAKIHEALAAQRKAALGEHNPELTELVDVTGTGDITPVRRPGTMPSGKRPSASPVPAPGTMR
jgi:peptidyl-prolyl cis-trans isomerase C